ncbi:MAG: hypothetical protein IKM29_04915 [Clostridia bacterium]|nr:hypothetical protein [Clostridia bacterium]
MNTVSFDPNGTEYITGLIAKAKSCGENFAVVTGAWEISSAVRIPSDFTIVLDGCHLKMADGVFDNMFVNCSSGTSEGRTLAGRDRNISIVGKNSPVLDGGNYNGLSERTANKNGLPPIWKNNLILFANVDGFEIRNLSCRNQRWWALNFLFCENGKISDIDFASCDIWIDEEGKRHNGLVRNRYSEILIKNSDGIDLRQGCRNIEIENITGFTEDDSVALTGLSGKMESEFAVEGLETDICNVSIKNVATAAFCSNVRLLNQGGIKLHDILIDGITDTSLMSSHMDVGIHTLRIGDTHLYGERHATADETYNITVKNIRSRASVSAISLAGEMTNVEIEEPVCAEGTVAFIDNRGK